MKRIIVFLLYVTFFTLFIGCHRGSDDSSSINGISSISSSVGGSGVYIVGGTGGTGGGDTGGGGTGGGGTGGTGGGDTGGGGTGGGGTGGGTGGGGTGTTAFASLPEVKIVVLNVPVHPGEISIAIEISDVVNAAGIYFKLNYDPKIIQIKNVNDPINSITEGAFFNQGGVHTGMVISFLDHNPDSGCLLAGLSRAGENPGINGSGTIMTFTFITVSTGSNSVKFSETVEDNSLFAPENPLESISPVKWTNVEVTVK